MVDAAGPHGPLTITLLHKNCGRNCNICAYGALDAIAYEKVEAVVDTLMGQGFRVQLYDFDVTSDSIRVFRRTRQYEQPNPGWLNVGAGFDPGPEDLAYVNRLDTAIVISLHGSTAEVHQRSSGRTDYHDICAFLDSYPRRFTRPLGINYVVGRENLGDIGKMVRFCRRFPLDFLEFIPLGFAGNAVGRMGPESILSAQEKYLAYRRIANSAFGVGFEVEMDAIWGPDFIRDADAACKFFAPAVAENYCNAGINHFAIRLNDMRIFPCPCMASLDSLAVGTFDGEALVIDENWMDHKDRIGEPCRSCDCFSKCKGGCRLTAMSDRQTESGSTDRFAGFDNCLYALTVRFGRVAASGDP